MISSPAASLLRMAIATVSLAMFAAPAFAGWVVNPSGGQVQFESGEYYAYESDGSVTVKVRRVGGTDGWAYVDYATASGTATTGSDFTSKSGTLEWWPATSNTYSIVIPLASDGSPEGDESFTIALSNPTHGVSLGTPSTATIHIVSTDGPGLPSVLFMDRISALGHGVKFTGPGSNAVAGWSLSGVGDYDDDGLEDIAIGAPYLNTGATGGRAYVLYGSENRFGGAGTIALGTGLATSGFGFQVTGTSGTDNLGYRVAGGGDFDGDGKSDLVLGGEEPSVGQHIVYNGAITGNRSLDTSPLSEAEGVQIVPGAAAVSPPPAIGAVVNGTDGRGQIVVAESVRHIDDNQNTTIETDEEYRGQVHVANSDAVSTGTIDLDLLQSVGGANGAFYGSGRNWRLGEGGVTGLGDVNGDGHSDYLMGSPGMKVQRPAGFYGTGSPAKDVNAGVAHLVYGPFTAFGVAPDGLEIAAIANQVVEISGYEYPDSATVSEYQRAGQSVSSAGDVNGDGLDDFLIAAPFRDIGGLDQAGEVYLVYGIEGGHSDSSPVPSGYLELPPSASQGVVIRGNGSLDWAGMSVAGVGDVDRDGYTDILVSAPGADPNGISGAGCAYVLYGSWLSTVSTASLSELPDSAKGVIVAGVNGTSGTEMIAAGAGDMDGDGYDDFLLGQPLADDTATNAGVIYLVYGAGPAASDVTRSVLIASGDAASKAIGLVPDGSESIPATRAWIDYSSGGSGMSEDEASLETVTIHDSNPGPLDGTPCFGGIAAADVHWRAVTDREGFTARTLTFHYRESELNGLLESELAMFESSDGTSWQPIDTTVDSSRNRISGVSALDDGWYAIGQAYDSGNVTFTMDTFYVYEGEGEAVLTVRRFGSDDCAAVVTYTTSDGTATAPGDYIASSGTIVLASDENCGRLPVEPSWTTVTDPELGTVYETTDSSHGTMRWEGGSGLNITGRGVFSVMLKSEGVSADNAFAIHFLNGSSQRKAIKYRPGSATVSNTVYEAEYGLDGQAGDFDEDEWVSLERDFAADIAAVWPGEVPVAITGVRLSSATGDTLWMKDLAFHSGPCNDGVYEIRIPVIADELTEEDETFTVTLAGPSAGSVIDPIVQAAVRIVTFDGDGLPSYVRVGPTLLGENDPSFLRVFFPEGGTPINLFQYLSLSGIGDVDGDGMEDFALWDTGSYENFYPAEEPCDCDPETPTPPCDGNSVVVYFGHEDFFSDLHVPATTTIWSPDDPCAQATDQRVPGNRFGAMLSGIGDINSDGYSDFVVGNQYTDEDNPVFDPNPLDPNDQDLSHGEFYIVFGSGDFRTSTIDLSAPDGLSCVKVIADQRSWNEVHTISSVEPPNGTAASRLITSNGYRAFTTIDPTDIWPAEIALHDANGDDIVDTFLGRGLHCIQPGGCLGDDVYDYEPYSAVMPSGIGDFDGDGYADFAVGGGKLDESIPVAFIYFGSATGDVSRVTSFRIDRQPAGTWLPTVNRFDDYSEQIAAAGDVNGDGRDDFIIAGGFTAYLIFGFDDPGSEYRLGDVGPGAPPELDQEHWLLISAENYSHLRYNYNGVSAVSTAGDVDGDGYCDLLIGFNATDFDTGQESAQIGRTYLIRGKSDGQVLDGQFDDMTGPYLPGYDHTGRVTCFENYASTSDLAGDLDGDGMSDFLISIRAGLLEEHDANPHEAALFKQGVDAPTSATWRRHLPAGNVGPIPIGTVGSGHQSVPFSRCWLDYAGGWDGEDYGASHETVSLYRTSPSSMSEPAAGVYWKLETTRTSFDSCKVTIRYLDSELSGSGLSESELVLFAGRSSSGPWKQLATLGRDGARNELSGRIPEGIIDEVVYLGISRASSLVSDPCDTIADCDCDGVSNASALATGLSMDCNMNGVPDECDVDLAVAFDGAGDEMVASWDADALGFASDQTVAFWLKLQRPEEVRQMSIMHHADSDFGFDFIVACTPHPSRDRYTVGYGALTETAGGSAFAGIWDYYGVPNEAPRLLVDEWHHIAFTIERSSQGRIRAFVDGVLNSEGSPIDLGGLYSPVSDLLVLGGSFSLDGSVDSLNGALDDVAVWSRELSEAEIRSVYDVGPSSVSSGLVSHWSFDRDMGDVEARNEVNTALFGLFQGDPEHIVADHPHSSGSDSDADGLPDQCDECPERYYRNPVESGAPWPHLADPMILYEDGRYYLFATNSTAEAWSEFGCWTSSDMVTWDYLGVAFSHCPVQDLQGLWSGDVIKRNDLYYMSYTLWYLDSNGNGDTRIGLAVAEFPQGPYSTITSDLTGTGGAYAGRFFVENDEYYLMYTQGFDSVRVQNEDFANRIRIHKLDDPDPGAALGAGWDQCGSGFDYSPLMDHFVDIVSPNRVDLGVVESLFSGQGIFVYQENGRDVFINAFPEYIVDGGTLLPRWGLPDGTVDIIEYTLPQELSLSEFVVRWGYVDSYSVRLIAVHADTTETVVAQWVPDAESTSILDLASQGVTAQELRLEVSRTTGGGSIRQAYIVDSTGEIFHEATSATAVLAPPYEWRSAKDNSVEFIELDLRDVYDLKSIRVLNGDVNGIAEFDVELSSDRNSYSALAQNVTLGSREGVSVDGSNEAARFVRLSLDKYSTTSVAALREVEVISSEGKNVAFQSRYHTSSTYKRFSIAEGPSLVKSRDGSQYQLLFTSGSFHGHDYSFSYATANNLYGPYTEHSNSVVTKKPESGMVGPGIGTFVLSPDGTEYWAAYNQTVDPWTEPQLFDRWIAMDRLGFRPDGSLYMTGPTRNAQPAPSSKGNVAAGATISTVPSSTSSESIVDGDIQTVWSSLDDTVPQQILLDLGALHYVVSARTKWTKDGRPSAYTILGSVDGVDYYQLSDADAAAPTWYAASVDYTDLHVFDKPLTARFIKLEATELLAGAANMSMKEFIVHGAPCSYQNVALGRPATVTGGTGTPAFITDGNQGSFWSPGSSGTVTIDLGATFAVQMVRGLGEFTIPISAAQVLTSIDGLEFVPRTSEPDFDNDTFLFRFKDRAVARYLRLEPGAAAVSELTELEVFAEAQPLGGLTHYGNVAASANSEDAFRAFDKNSQTAWNVTETEAALSFETGFVTTVEAVAVEWADSGVPDRYELQASSDGFDYYTVWASNSSLDGNSGIHTTIPPVSSRYWRMQIGLETSGNMGIRELRLLNELN